MEKIILNPGKALGDTLCAIAVAKGIKKKVSIASKQIFHPLFQGTGITPELNSNKEGVIISYWGCISKLNKLPEGKSGHIVDWMNFYLEGQHGIKSSSTKGDVKIKLTEEELLAGEQFCKKISNGKPVVAIAPSATTKNRTLPKQILKKILFGISHFSTPLVLGPPEMFGAESLPKEIYEDLRKIAATIAATDAMITIDSGLAHLAAAAYQGNKTNLAPEKVIIILGSSNPPVICYNGNHVIQNKRPCSLPFPCGAHGYSTKEQAELKYHKNFYKARDCSCCISLNYPELKASPCMENTDTKKVIETTRIVLEK